MVEIRYQNNENGAPVIFDFLFSLKEYIPARYYDISPKAPDVLMFEDTVGPAEPELYFYMDLLDKAGLRNSRVGLPLIWSIHFACNYNGANFTMIYDEDYEMVSFAVLHTSKRQEIAEYIKHMIEHQKPGIGSTK